MKRQLGILLILMGFLAPVRGQAVSAPLIISVSPAGTQLCGDLSRQFTHEFTLIGTNHFQLVYDADPAWAQNTSDLLEKVYQRFHQDFASFRPLRPAGGPLYWVCFSQKQDFANYALQHDQMDMSWLDSYYSTRTNRVVLYRAIFPRPNQITIAQAEAPGTKELAPGPTGPLQNELHPARLSIEGDGTEVIKASHEAAHQLSFNSGLLRRGVMYPMWVTEGISTNFEADRQGEFGMERINRIRRDDLLQAWENGRLLPLAQMAVIIQAPAAEGTSTNDLYAQSWGLFRFMYEEHREQLRNYLKELSELQSGRRGPWMVSWELEYAFGPLGELDTAWKNFLARMSNLRQQEISQSRRLVAHQDSK